MGSGMEYRCRSCGNTYYACFGIGMFFPEEYAKVLKKIKKGKYGKELQEIALNTPHVAVDAETYLYECRKCGNWRIEEGLSLYEPDDFELLKDIEFGQKTVRQLGEMPYVMWSDIRKYYHIVKRYVHKCDKCGSRMHKLTVDEIDSLPCPKCGGEPDEDFTTDIRWD